MKGVEIAFSRLTATILACGLARRSSRAQSVERDRGSKGGSITKRGRFAARRPIAVLRARNVPIAASLTRAGIQVEPKSGKIPHA
jgi:hypothetical protein